jgi:hypothetical protein
MQAAFEAFDLLNAMAAVEIRHRLDAGRRSVRA